uniref:GRF-type domain-containing protein n=1 Tax=Solanum tuberosum TaxID=4113 RepID=M1DIE2_SOLTU
MEDVKLDLNSICFDKDDPKLNEEVRCFHGLLLPLKTSWSDNNPGRRFWSCPYYGSQKCKYFRWSDDVVNEHSKFIIHKLVKKMKDMNELLVANVKKMKVMEEINGFNDRQITEMEAQSVFTQLEEQSSLKEMEGVLSDCEEVDKLIEVKKKWSSDFSLNKMFMLCLLIMYVVVWIKLSS